MTSNEPWRELLPFRASIHAPGFSATERMVRRCLEPHAAISVLDLGAGWLHIDCELEDDAVRYQALGAMGLMQNADQADE